MKTVTVEDIRKNIVDTRYFTAYEGVLGERFNHEGPEDNDRGEKEIPDPLRLLTLCVLILENDFTVVGKSACADPAKYNKGIGQKVAYDDAFRQIWPLMGYELRSQLHSTPTPQASAPAQRAEGERQAEEHEAVEQPSAEPTLEPSPFKRPVDTKAGNIQNPY